jgi:hypothetical protein
MFALCGNRTRDLLRSRRVFPPLRQVGRQYLCTFSMSVPISSECFLSLLSSFLYPFKYDRYNIFSSSILFYLSSFRCCLLFILMSSFTQSIHLFLGRSLIGCPFTFILITLFIMWFSSLYQASVLYVFTKKVYNSWMNR